MPMQAGQGGRRVDCKHVAPCGGHSLYYCRLYCTWWETALCQDLSDRAKKIRQRKKDKEAAEGGEG
jgi:hypothetical protein